MSLKPRIHMLDCPLREHSTSFQLVDEFGDGQPYAGLTYQLIDYEDIIYTGTLDATGSGKVDKHYCGPVELRFNQAYQGNEKAYTVLSGRDHYPLPITELQVRAEKTRFFNKSGARTQTNPAQEQASAEAFCQVEVRELVEYGAHLPPLAERHFPPKFHAWQLFRPLPVKGQTGYRPELAKRFGIPLAPNKHHVLEVRPLRALRPMLSTGEKFCALNLYQLSLMATLSYTDFSQQPNTQPVATDKVSFPTQPSSGNWFGHALAQFDELWQVDAGQAAAGHKAYYPLYEEVPYSKRLEVVPFDPELYPAVNSPSLGDAQENPANTHFFDDRKTADSTDTQAFITHHDELILISVRGTSELWPDVMRDINALQVPFAEGVGMVHDGFYGAAKVVNKFVSDYLDKFYSGQKLVITGHSLGGAIALILAEMLRRDERYEPDILLYTYGAPRAGDESFVKGAKPLRHHRIVNHNDPIPSLPATWMNIPKPTPAYFAAKGLIMVLNASTSLRLFTKGALNSMGEPYAHHGELRHFMRVDFGPGQQSSILWDPSCSVITEQGCARVLQEIDGLPVRGSLMRQLLNSGDHMMVASYIPHCWASLRRWQEAQERKRSLVTDSEFEWVDGELKSITTQLRDLERSLGVRLDSHAGAQQVTVNRLREEIGQLHMTRARLAELRDERVSEGKVYGLFAGQPELLEEGLLRWRTHLENIAPEQLAMAPPEADDDERAIAEITGGHIIGAPFHLDIDSIT